MNPYHFLLALLIGLAALPQLATAAEDTNGTPTGLPSSVYSGLKPVHRSSTDVRPHRRFRGEPEESGAVLCGGRLGRSLENGERRHHLDAGI